MDTTKYDEIAKQMGEVKRGIMDAFVKDGKLKSPAVAHSVQLVVDHLDSAYLWLSQAAQLAQMVSEPVVEKVVQDASRQGKIQVLEP